MLMKVQEVLDRQDPAGVIKSGEAERGYAKEAEEIVELMTKTPLVEFAKRFWYVEHPTGFNLLEAVCRDVLHKGWFMTDEEMDAFDWKALTDELFPLFEISKV